MPIADIIRRARPGSVAFLPAGQFVCSVVVDKPLIIQGHAEGTHLQPRSGQPALKIQSHRVLVCDISITGSAAADPLVEIRRGTYPELRNVRFRDGTIDGRCALENCITDNVIRRSAEPSAIGRNAMTIATAAVMAIVAICIGYMAIRATPPPAGFVSASPAPAPPLSAASHFDAHVLTGRWIGSVRVGENRETLVLDITPDPAGPGDRFHYTIKSPQRDHPKETNGFVDAQGVLIPLLGGRGAVLTEDSDTIIQARASDGTVQWKFVRQRDAQEGVQ